jgi:type IV pilus assembly protein PilC
LFAKQFSVMLHAGLPLVQCLSVLGEQQENAGFKATLAEVRADVEGGSTLADALRRHPKTFNRLFTDMISAGEVGGFLDVAFKQLSVYIQRAVKMKSQALAASAYPLIVMVVALVTVSLTLVWVVPVFVSLFQGLDVPLPLLTRIVIVGSNWTKRFSIPFTFLVLLGAIGLRYLRYRPEGQLMTDRVLLGVPLIGKVLGKIAVARFSLTLATLLRSGIPLLKGLEITAACSGNCVFRNALTLVRKEVLNGRAVFEPMEESGVFPPLVTRMVAVGEQAGELDQMLEHLSDFYEEESEAAVSQLMTALEPTLVVLLGILVGGIVISMYLPIFSLVGHFAH